MYKHYEGKTKVHEEKNRNLLKKTGKRRKLGKVMKTF